MDGRQKTASRTNILIQDYTQWDSRIFEWIVIDMMFKFLYFIEIVFKN